MLLSEVRVPALDRGYLFGEGIYEVIRVYGGKVWRGGDHLRRLASSLKELDIQFDSECVPKRVEQTLLRSQLKEALVYVQITRQDRDRHHYYPSSPEFNCLIYLQPFDDPYEKERQTGVHTVTYPDIRWSRNDIKATSLVANCMAAQAARSKDCFESILVRDGLITEGSHSSVFAVIDGQLVVPPSSSAVLPGITKSQVLELCKARSINILERQLLVSDLPSADELFLTATPEEIIGIIKVDEQTVGNGTPGPITQQLHEAFQQNVAQIVGSRV